ncbi:homeobox 4 [Fusarium circinatum]|uniref:tyrosine--tRNA ligase n=1 Tax=Fusarium circinatum TaxID=48490 RepID=A0A8H5TYF3_FUSCI|nr:homeobox 4 [Fusarium circinatum]
MPDDPEGGMLLPRCDDDGLSFWCRQLFNDDHHQSVIPGDFVVGSLPDNLASFDLPWPAIGEYAGLTTHNSYLPSDLPAVSSPQPQQLPPTTSSGETCHPACGSLPPKSGTRFSKDALKVLKDWLSSHSDHPYLDEEDREMLQRQTGLNKTQISNWLTNARRRRKVQRPRSTSPYVRNTWTGPIDIPRRPDTPAFQNDAGNLNPLERWVDSPPENEPASVTAIAQAVALNSKTSSGQNSPRSLASTDDGSNPSVYNASSASSAGTSSGASFGSLTRQRGRRRRRPVPKRKEKPSSAVAIKKFQCTFCTDTFGTKYDWQRHEKSLHLSLERWMCAPNGPRVLDPQNNQNCCAFCGEVEPSDDHIESHNLLACMERRPEDRTFYRKDHLNQHLRLMHNVKFLDWSMKSWKVTGPDIRSRCGFCGIVMPNWSTRVDHLAEHFRKGDTMASWRGDWGFDVPVLKMVENFIPPYLIENDRRSPNPYIATAATVEIHEGAHEFTKLELHRFPANHQESTRPEAGSRELNEIARRQTVRTFSGGCSDVIPATVAGQAGAFFLTDTNCYRRLFRELRRFVTSIMSPNNPNCHVPTDAEIQHQARCIIFDDDDPWNQTAADNAEWLLRFKRDAGILPSGPGLSLDTNGWNIANGGTGFAPPYAFPNKRMLDATSSMPTSVTSPSATNGSTMTSSPVMISPGFEKVEIFIGNNATPFETNQALLDGYIETFSLRYDRPAIVFCSRELENGLVGFVEAEIARGAGFPSDEALKLRGREILGTAKTSADDPSLLERFKAWMFDQRQQEQVMSSGLAADADIGLTNAEIDSILSDIAELLHGACHVKILLADKHAHMDSHAPIETIKHRCEYYRLLIKSSLNAIGVDVSKLEFVVGSSFQDSKEYQDDRFRFSNNVTVSQLIKAGSEVVKQGENPTLGSVEYPIWQSLDEEYLDADAELGGVDQRKLFTFAIDHMPKLGYKVRAHLMNAMVPGLGEAQKMSSSEPSSKINLLDTPEEVTKKLRKAVCAPKQVEGNGVIAFIEHVIFRVESLKTGGEPKFTIETRDGETLVYEDISKLKEDYASDALTPQMIKPALIKTLNELLDPIRKDFEADEDWQRVAQLAYPPEEKSKKTKMGKKKGKVQYELPIRTRQD